METSKHTPGPWYATGSDPDFGLSVRRASDHEVIAKIEVAYSGSAANARLIAAAPEMYRLLADLAKCYSQDLKTIEYQRVAVSARALLAKIDGGDDA